MDENLRTQILRIKRGVFKVDPKRDLKIRLLRKRGKTYLEIKKELHVGRSTISKVLAMKDTGSDAGPSRTAAIHSSSVGGEHIYSEKRTIRSDRAVDGGTGTGGTAFLNKKRTGEMAEYFNRVREVNIQRDAHLKTDRKSVV
jgi:hypothetical protein